MIPKPKSCENCVLYQDGQGFLQVEGTGAIPLMLVGESSGYGERLEGLPFRPSSPAGSILHRVIQEKVKFNRSQFSFANLIFCQPYQDRLLNTPYEFEAINECRPNLDKAIAKFKPKVILALGALPFKHLVGLTGKNTEITKIRGYVFKSSRYPDVLIIPTLHPSYIRRGNMHLMNVLVQDFMKAANIAQGKGLGYIIDPFSNKDLIEDYKTKPSVEEAELFLQAVLNDSNLLVTYDIETDKSIGEDEDELEEYGVQITQIQFSINKNSGIAFPYYEPFISIAKDILKTPNPKAGHNVYDFDNPILEKDGFVINGRIDDTMLLFHHYQPDLPLNLQFVSSFFSFPFPWKHFASSNIQFYGIADVTSVQYIMNQLPNQLKSRGLWEGYDKYVYSLKPILVKMENRGLPINIKKQDEFKEEINLRKIEINKELEEIVPDSLKGFHPIGGYKKVPKEVLLAMDIFNYSKDLDKSITMEDFIYKRTGMVEVEFTIKDPKQEEKISELIKLGVKITGNLGIGLLKEKRYCKLIQFNPNSPDQVSNYIKLMGDEQLAKKLVIKISKKDSKVNENEDKIKKDNLSTSKGIILALYHKTGNIVYKLIVEYRELGKIEGSYLWKPSEDNRVHSHFTFRSATGQLTARNPAIQTGPVHTNLAYKFQETIEAEEGRVLESFDYRGFHALMLGYLSGDENYMRLSKIDVHSYVTAHLVKYPDADKCLNWSDEKLKEYLKDIKSKFKSIRDRRAKVTILGIGLGLSENGCYERYRDGFDPTPEEALMGKRKIYKGEELQKIISQIGRKRVKSLYDLLRELFPRIFKYQSEVIIEADKGWYDTKFGFRRWFSAASEVKYYSNGNIASRTKGEEAEEAIAFPVQNNAHGHLREGVLILEKMGLLDKYRLVNTIHDSLVFEPNLCDVEESLVKVKEVMERESGVLKGFSCMVDVKIGKSLAVMKEV